MEKTMEKSLTKTSRRTLRKGGLPEEFIQNSYVWMTSGEMTLGNYILYNGKFTRKDANRLRSILPHMRKQIKKTALACGWKGKIKLHRFITEITGIEYLA